MPDFKPNSVLIPSAPTEETPALIVTGDVSPVDQVALDGAQLTVLHQPVNAERIRAELQRRLSTSAAV